MELVIATPCVKSFSGSTVYRAAPMIDSELVRVSSPSLAEILGRVVAFRSDGTGDRDALREVVLRVDGVPRGADDRLGVGAGELAELGRDPRQGRGLPI